jgi:hypothetical protein
MRVLAPLFAFALVACASTPVSKSAAPGQPFAAAVGMMCDVDRLAAIAADGDPLGAGPKRSAWIAEHVDNPDAIELRTLMSVKGAGEQAKLLREQAKAAGVARCALADALEQSGMGGLSP